MKRLPEKAAISARFGRGDTPISFKEARDIVTYINGGLQDEELNKNQTVRPELLQVARDVLDGKSRSMDTSEAYQEIVYHHIDEDDMDPKVTAAAAQWSVIQNKKSEQAPSRHLTPEEQELVSSLVDTGFSIEQAFTVIDGWRGSKPSITVEVDPSSGVVNKKYSRGV